MGLSGHIGYIYIAYIGLFGTGICRFIQVLYLGRAPRTKETLPDFRDKCRVTRHSRAFRGLTSSQRTPGFWGVTIAYRLAFIAQHDRCSRGVSRLHTPKGYSRSSSCGGLRID